jgi:uncharacterized membrane protein
VDPSAAAALREAGEEKPMTNEFAHFDSDRIVQAIGAAETTTSAEIRVHVTRRIPDDLEARALRRFHLIGMTKTKERNGVLLYIAPRAHQFRLLGDIGIHEKAGPEFWTAVAAAMEEHFRKGEFTEGAVEAVRAIGEKLAAHFPRQPGDRDELPNTVDRD